MQDIIRLLPDSIANQIAAGEVVQRPSSVVKELLENSIDAQAKSIRLIVKESGKQMIQVIDDGVGMSLTDARMSFERHATSKIQVAEDLYHIKSMGFRGEALASIAAVAQVEMKTSTGEGDLGTMLQVEASEVKKQEPTQQNKGTSISVKNLFYNVPARRNFLKSNPVELKHIIEEFQRVALAHPEVRFSLHHNDQEVLLLDAGKISKRIVDLFGKNYQKQLIPCQEETPDIQINGYVGKPDFAKKTRGEQYFFINNRFIKNGYLNHAVTQAYESMLPNDYYPFYVLNISIDPARIDINVHPTKTEVKFDDDRLMYGVVASAVRQALAAHNVTPSLDFDTDVNFDSFLPSRNEQGISQRDAHYGSFKSLDSKGRVGTGFQQHTNSKNWEMLYQGASGEDLVNREQAKKEIILHWEQQHPAQEVTIPSKGNESDLNLEKDGVFNKTLQIHGRYLARQVKSGMVLVDQCAAHERILFEKYIKRTKSQEGVSQSSLFPQQIRLNPADLALITEMKQEINLLGFDFEVFGRDAVVINGVPPEIVNTSEKEVFEGLIEQFKLNKSRLELTRGENLARALAKRTSINIGQQLQKEEINQLFDQLFACEQPNFTPEGQPTFVVLSLSKLASLF
jgi:DNA mismatch repair protein MutL